MQPRLAAVCWLIISNCQMGKLCKKRLVTAWRNDENYRSHGGLLGPGRCNGQAMIYSQLGGSTAIKIIRFQ